MAYAGKHALLTPTQTIDSSSIFSLYSIPRLVALVVRSGYCSKKGNQWPMGQQILAWVILSGSVSAYPWLPVQPGTSPLKFKDILPFYEKNEKILQKYDVFQPVRLISLVFVGFNPHMLMIPYTRWESCGLQRHPKAMDSGHVQRCTIVVCQLRCECTGSYKARNNLEQIASCQQPLF